MILVLNIGLKNARVIAFDFDGCVNSDISFPVRTFIRNDCIEQNPDHWIRLTEKLLEGTIHQLREKVEDIKYITVTTSASCLVAIDKNGKPLCNSLLVSDSRSISQCITIQKNINHKNINHKNIKITPDLMIPKILWIKENWPKVYNNTYKFLNISDYLTLYLTGEIITDPNNASKFLFDLKTNKYPESLFNIIGIDKEKLPTVLKIGQVVKKVRPSINNKLGSKFNPLFVNSTYDALATVAGNGAFKVGDAVDVSGTVTSVRAISDKYLIDKMDRVYTSKHIINNQWLIGGSNNLGGGLIEWQKNVFYKNFKDPYKVMEKDASKTEPCPGGLIFLPYLMGERSPIWDPDSSGTFFGINRMHKKNDFTRAVFEGAGFSTLHIVDTIKSLKLNINNLTVAGGLSRIPLINQIKSDMLNIPVKQFHNFETTAIGAAIIVLKSQGEYKTIESAFNIFCKPKYIYEPNQKNNDIYNDYFELYKDIYLSLNQTFKKRKKIVKKIEQQDVKKIKTFKNI